MIVHFCDLCKKEIHNTDTLREIKFTGMGAPEFYIKYELCHECAETLLQKLREGLTDSDNNSLEE